MFFYLFIYFSEKNKAVWIKNWSHNSKKDIFTMQTVYAFTFHKNFKFQYIIS